MPSAICQATFFISYVLSSIGSGHLLDNGVERLRLSRPDGHRFGKQLQYFKKP
jgi:hypothetical protein